MKTKCQIKFDGTIDNHTRDLLQCVADYGMCVLDLDDGDIDAITICQPPNRNAYGWWDENEYAITICTFGDMVHTMLHELYHAWETMRVIRFDEIMVDAWQRELNANEFAALHAHRAMDAYIYN